MVNVIIWVKIYYIFKYRFSKKENIMKNLLSCIFKKEISTNYRIKFKIFGCKIFSYKLTLEKIHRIYNKLENKLKSKTKIKVAFLITSLSMFSAENIMKKMIKDSLFDVKIILAPEVRFGKDYALNIQNKAKEELKEYAKYLIVAPINEAEDNIDVSKYADLIFYSLPYNDFSSKKYNLCNMIQNGVLPVFINYSFYNAIYDREDIISSKNISMFWKIFCNTPLDLLEFKKYALNKDNNVILTGYPKMDGYIKNDEHHDRKTIMIAPHHSIAGGLNDKMALSNFLKYSELFLELPKRYKNLFFIFRPHPALFPLLEKEDFWGKEKVREYISNIKNNENLYFSETGSYFEDFGKSDCLINDCGSFLTEYFYTNKPQCYMLKDVNDIKNKFITLGEECLNNCCLAYDEEDIINFIDNVVVLNKDIDKEKRIEFSKENIMINYPNASNSVIEYIKGIIR